MTFTISNARRMGTNTPGLRRTADESRLDIVYVSRDCIAGLTSLQATRVPLLRCGLFDN